MSGDRRGFKLYVVSIIMLSGEKEIEVAECPDYSCSPMCPINPESGRILIREETKRSRSEPGYVDTSITRYHACSEGLNEDCAFFRTRMEIEELHLKSKRGKTIKPLPLSELEAMMST